MHRLARAHTLIGLVAASFASAHLAMAQDAAPSGGGGDDPVQAQLRQMQEQLEALRNENQTMKGEIDELRAATNEDWLTEARADEIRGLVSEVLSDADTRASLLQDGLMAGWSEHFFLASADGRFKLIIDGAMQIRYVYNYLERAPGSLGDQHRQGFEHTRMRLTFRGHVFSSDIQYLIRSEFARAGGTGNDQLLDAWVRYNFSDEWSIRFGQFKIPFNREELVSPFEQLAVERSLVNEIVNLGRSQGIELSYHDDQNRLSLATTDGASPNPLLLGNAALLGGPHTNTSAIALDVEYDAAMRYERLAAGTWEQFDDFTSPRDDEFGLMWGIAVHAQEGESTGVASFLGQSSTRAFGATADLSVEWGGANAFVSATYHYVDTPINPQNFQNVGLFHIIGIVAQVGVYVTPKWELFLRGEFAEAENRSTPTPTNIPDLNLVTVGANYYLNGQDLKWSTDLGVAISDVSGFFASDLAGYRANADNTAPQVVFRTQFQLLF
ncbi:MAG: hypothetical protein L0Y44_11200 [Phycisphaerales bacterium]|nr:hypothetical protein [Phycisphaerales bacterium]